MTQITEMNDRELWSAAYEELAAADAMAAARTIGALLAEPGEPGEPGEGEWYVAPGTDASRFVSAIGEHAYQIGGAP